MTKISKRYKETKFGIIPENWEIRKLEEVFEFLNTYSYSRENLTNEILEESIHYIHYGDIHMKYRSHLDITTMKEEIPKLKNEFVNMKKYVFLQNGDLIVADASEDYKDIGKTIEVKNIQSEKVIAGLHTFLLRDKINKTIDVYRSYLFLNFDVIKSIKRLATGASVLGISKSNLARIDLLLPPLPEQKVIAEILTTWDLAIEKQEGLISLKKEQKNGFMENLLSGKVRLKEFINSNEFKNSKIGNIPEDWRAKKLGDICKKIIDGTHNTPKYVETGVPFYSVENVTSDNFVNTKYISPIEHELLSKRCFVEKNDILLTRIGTLGKAKLITWNVKASIYVSLALFKLNFNKVEPEFLVQLFNSVSFNRQLKKNSLLSAIPQKINLNEIEKLVISLPPLPEQKAIANILTTADKEIELLEKELEKLKEQKKGLMQNLLTGKVRVKIN